MALNGSFNTGAYGDRYLVFSWTGSQNIGGNYTDIYWSLKGSGGATNFYYKAGNFKVVIEGETVYNSSNRIELFNGTTVATGVKRIYHNSNGTKTFSAYAEAGIYTYAVNCTGSNNWTLDNIPRYATSKQSLNSKTETTITINWLSDNTIDYLWYSINNGSNWNAVGTVNGTSGTYTITGLNAETTYNIKTRVRRKDSQLTTDSTVLTVRTENAPTIALHLKEETSIVVRWTSNYTIDQLHYSIDNGSNWIQQSVIEGTTEICRINNLTPNTTYNIKLRLRRKDTQTTCDTATLVEATYDYPHIENVKTKDLVIGNQQDISIYNPMGHDIILTMYKNEETREEIISYNTSGTNITILPINVLYESIPNSRSAKCIYSIKYNDIEKIIDNGYTYKIKGTEVPSFNDFQYKDTNTMLLQTAM